MMDDRIEKLKSVFGNRPFTAASAAPILTPGKENSWGAAPMLRAMVNRGEVLLIKKANGPSEQSVYSVPMGDADTAPIPAALVEQRAELWALEFGRWLISPSMLVVMRHEGGANLFIGNDTFAVSAEDWANRRLVNLADPSPPRVDADTEALRRELAAMTKDRDDWRALAEGYQEYDWLIDSIKNRKPTA
jgi:hypothetical protein